MKYKQKEIVLVPFPYSDLSTIKRRPVLIISNESYNDSFDDVIVCAISSNKFKDEFSIDLVNDDLETGSLPEPSVIKVHKLFTIHKSKIVKRFSLLKQEAFLRVTHKFNELIKT